MCLNRKLKKVLRNPGIILDNLFMKLPTKWINDEYYIRIRYKLRMNKSLNLYKPVTFNEKLQWLKLYDRNTSYTKMVDKYEVRKYIAEQIGEEYLIPLIGVYENFDEINFDELPEQFVLKCTHDSGGVVICKDKNKLDKVETREKINKSLRRNYYNLWREWPYKNIKPKIICEKYMIDESSNDLKDYKFMCFNGQVKLLFVCVDRNDNLGLKINFYDNDWNLLDLKKKDVPNIDKQIEKPKMFEQMINLAERLSKDIPFIRVDFYEINGRLYFGELTFYPDAGMMFLEPHTVDSLLGSWINLLENKLLDKN